MGKLYAASRASIPARSAMWRELRASGVTIVSSWIDEAGEGESDSLDDLWVRIASEIKAADALVLYAESGDFPLKGAFIEVGMALALGKKVYTVLPGVNLEYRSMRPLGSWAHHPLVTMCGSVDEAVSMANQFATPTAPKWNEGDTLKRAAKACEVPQSEAEAVAAIESALRPMTPTAEAVAAYLREDNWPDNKGDAIYDGIILTDNPKVQL